VAGVDPDITVDDTAQGNLFRLPREIDLQRHLTNSAIPEEEIVPAIDEESGEDAPKIFEFGGADDFQLQQAVNVLQGRPVKKNDPELVAQARATAEATAVSSSSTAAAEKKSPVKTDPSRVERYRITPSGMVPVEP